MQLVEGGELTVNGAYALYAVGAGCIGADDLLQFIGGIDPGLGRLPTVRAVITVNEPLRVQKMM
jgi:large exoprotein involved in heme utilization and adhesion